MSSDGPDTWLGLADRRIVVLGAGAFGGQCALSYLALGARVAIGDSDAARLKQLWDDATARFGDVTDALHVLDADVQASRDCEQFVEGAARRLGGIDVALHAVGINIRNRVTDITDDAWDAVMTVNLTSAFWFSRAVIPLLRNGDAPRLIMFSSVSDRLAHPKHGAYAASKGGMRQLIRVLAVEHASDGIHVNGISPGYVETNLTSDYLAVPGVRDDLESMVPMGRLGIVDDVVGPVMFLSSPRSNFMTGQSLVIDGGRSLD